jgi:hypothetical protein
MQATLNAIQKEEEEEEEKEEEYMKLCVRFYSRIFLSFI